MATTITERLIVRRPTEADLHDFLAYQTHPDNLKYQPVEPMTEDQALDFLSRMAALDSGEADGWIMFGVELRSERRMIGEVGIFLSPSPQSKGDLGWSFHPDFQGQGYATEAAQILLAYAFNERKLHRVTSSCDTRNTASFRLMERLGMRREGHLRQSLFTKGAWRDEYLYALLHDEWHTRTEGR
jgi:RimJ/RimL family protein N-acetyltransferase